MEKDELIKLLQDHVNSNRALREQSISKANLYEGAALEAEKLIGILSTKEKE